MELNCNQRWSLGNLKNDSVQDIYLSQKRRDFLNMANRIHWGPEVFHPFTRAARLDRIARAIMREELSQTDIDAIRRESFRSHQLLLD